MKEVHFKTNILLKNIIGKDLITSDNIAVLELVKNAYDAGSPIVVLDFRHLLSNDTDSSLIISDRGSGMDYDGLVNRWLNIAYSEKKDQVWMNGRRQAGNKGVGRFSCDRLGKCLTIYTKSPDRKCLKLSIDWTAFEDENSQDAEIQDVALKLEEVSDQSVLDLTGWDSFEHGTILFIQDLREQWSVQKLLRLKRDLEKFLSPNQSFQNNSFSIEIKASDYLEYDSQHTLSNNRINGQVYNQVFDKLNFKTSSISSSIDDTGEFIVTTLTDRGRTVFVLKEKNVYPHLRNIKIHTYYLNTYSKRYFNMQTGFSSIDFGSIFLFINGFRVPPYGDQGDDWLGIEKRKSSGYRRYLSTREVIGRIEITDDDNSFNIITSRSGVVHNDAFDELSREGVPYGFFYKTFRRLERFVVEGIKWDKTGDNISNETKGDEGYLLDDFSRNKQIISVIRNIIDITDDNIIDLQINEDLVQSILDEQIEQTQTSLETILGNLSEITENMDIDGIHRYQQKLTEDSDELGRLIKIVNRLAPNTDKLLEIQAIKNTLENNQEKFRQMEEDLKAAQQAKEEAEAEKLRLSQELELEKEKNTYLLTSSRGMSDDAKNMVHNIKIISTDIASEVENVLYLVESGLHRGNELLSTVSNIKFLNDKALKISKLITRANFRSESAEQIVNIPEYLKQYIDIYKDIVGKCSVNMHIETHGIVFKRSISILDLALMVDNLVSNSQKANASNIWFEVNLISSSELEISVSDDGDGLDSTLQFNPDKMFELGVTTTDGSGIGLFAIKTALKKIGCDIRYNGMPSTGKGAVFNITIKK